MQMNLMGLTMRFGSMTATRFVKNCASGANAFAALKPDPEFKLKIVQRVIAFGHGAADVTITDGVADTDNHVLDKT